MKKVSIIVPVYNVEKYLKRCLNSLVNQTLTDIEVILVNDGSKDKSQEIINEFKEKYPEKIKAFETVNGGAAKARNYALEHVTGEYIGFVDSDDYVEEDMYEKLYNKAIEENAEIVCCNYYRVQEEVNKFSPKRFGNQRINKDNVFNKSIYEEKLLFDEVPYLWNKIFKADIIKNNNIKFENDLRIYEDLLFTYKAFSKANKISRIEDNMYYYIVSREGSLTQYLTEKRFDIFKVTEKLIEYYTEIGKYEELKEAILYVILKHIYVILEKKTYSREKKLKLKYINQAFTFLNKTFPDWKENMYFELQNRNKKTYTSKLYWKLCTIIGYNITDINRKLKKLFEFAIFIRPGNVYKKQYTKPIDAKKIFIYPQQGNNLNGNMFYIVKELATNDLYKDYKIYIGYSENNKNKFIKLLESYNILNRVKFVKSKTRKFSKVLARSKYLFTDTSMPTYFIKREEQVYLNTWHGTPLKTLGKSTENDFFDIANVQKNFIEADYLLYPSEYMKDIMIRDYMLSGIAKNKIMLCGYPRNEVFLRDDAEKVKEQYHLEEKTLIAYMPTWRGSVRSIDIENQIKIAEEHIKEISEKLTENQILYINMHPYIGNMIDISKYSNVRLFPKEKETYDFLSICDILITDYSSVFFDFAVTNKKIILFAYDEKEYFADRGVYLPFTELPFPKVENIDDLIKEINSTTTQYNISEFLNKFCQYERKNMSKLICEKVTLNKQNEIKILDIPKENKENILLYSGDFKPDSNTKNFVKLVENSLESNKYNYYISYITKNLRQNKNIFKKISKKVKFYGQLGVNTNASKFDILLVKLLGKKKKLYNTFRKRYDQINKTEIARIYGGINLKAVIFYGEVDYKKLYQLSVFECKKILYVKNKNSFNKNINAQVYNKLDCVAVENQETFDMIKKYCGQDNNIRLVDKIEKVEDFDKLI